jgi:hypothetical protein
MDYICTSVNANSLAHGQPYFLINEKSLKVYMYTSGKGRLIREQQAGWERKTNSSQNK